MNEITIEITGYCPNNCDYCSSDAGPNGKPLPFEKIYNFLDENRPKGKEFAPYFDRINISGGEPLSHPDFWKIFELCKIWGERVVLYTTAIEEIAYNTKVIKELHVHANVPLVPGSPAYIPKGSFRVHLLKFISQGRGKSIKEVNMQCSSNLSDNSKCENCHNLTLKANGEVASRPCKKN